MRKKFIVVLYVMLLVNFTVTMFISNVSFASENKKNLNGITQLSGVNNSFYAISEKGDLWVWGYNQYGNLGLGDEKDRFAPVHMITSTPKNFKQVRSGRHITAALTSDGQVMSWSEKWPGKSENQSSVPALVKGFNNIKQITVGGEFVLGLDTSGKVWAWGNNNNDQIPEGDQGFIDQPFSITGLPSNVTSITANENGGFALTDQGEVWYWQGEEKNQPAISPKLLKGLSSIKSIHEGGKVLTAIDSKNHAWVYDPESKQLLKLAISSPIKSISTQQINNIAVVTTTGKVYAITSNKNITLLKGYPSDSVDVEQNVLATLVLTRSGEVWSLGSNVNGQLGINSKIKHTQKPQPVIQPIQLKVNGKWIQPTNTTKMINNVVYVPIRGVLEEIGAKVTWNKSAKNKVIITKSNLNIQLNTDEKKAKVNGKTVNLDAPPQYINGSIMVPLRLLNCY